MHRFWADFLWKSLHGSLARIPGAIWGSAHHSNITRGDRFATRGHPWRARFCDLWKKRMDFKKKFTDFHQKFLTNGASTCTVVQRHQIVMECRLLNLKSMQNPLHFGTFSGRVGDICRFGWCLCTLKHRLSLIFDENQKTFFLKSFFSSKDRENVLSTGVHGWQTDLHG